MYNNRVLRSNIIMLGDIEQILQRMTKKEPSQINLTTQVISERKKRTEGSQGTKTTIMCSGGVTHDTSKDISLDIHLSTIIQSKLCPKPTSGESQKRVIYFQVPGVIQLIILHTLADI